MTGKSNWFYRHKHMIGTGAPALSTLRCWLGRIKLASTFLLRCPS
jgi:hypothetical protein